MKLYFDEHVHPLVAVMLRERGIDCCTTQEAGNLGTEDEDQLRYATAQGRVLARIIHERFCCNRRSAAATSLRPAGSQRDSAISRRTVMNNAG